jgi:ribonucleoside-triphosphate reductase
MFKDALAEFVYTRTYSRWNEEQQRRETWEETVDRLVDFYGETAKGSLELKEYKELKQAILNHEVYPSMRLLWAAGDSARRNNISVYNCAYHPCISVDSFATTMFLLLHGTGVGFSVEKQYVDKLPVIASKNDSGKMTVLFQDSKEGWAFGLDEVIQRLWEGYDVEWDLSKIRPKGAILKVSGGRASGPEPLENTLKFVKGMIEGHRGRKLSPLNCHDLMCKIAESVVVGGSRRSAMISLSDLDDQGMAHAKDGAFWTNHIERAMSNNSAVYNQKPTSVEFMREWLILAESGSGERGIFNREGAVASLPTRRKKHYDWGCNPCAEILLRGLNQQDENDHGGQFCNLTTVIIRSDDTLESLKRKVRFATIMGTIQAAMTDFGKLEELSSGSWTKNTKEEALLGVSLNGQMDAPHLMTAENLKALRKVSRETNEEYASRLGIKKSSAISCVKPEGTSSIVASCSSGIHPRFSPFYVRRVRISGTDPLYKMMKDQGVKFYPEVGQNPETATIWVCEFPVKSPEDAVCASEMTAIQQLENWLKLKKNWAEHTVSCTVYVKEDEWMTVGNWVYDHWEHVTGISFLPYSDHVYQLAPMEAISESKYYEMLNEQVEIDYSKLADYEKEDFTIGAQNLACSGGNCEL